MLNIKKSLVNESLVLELEGRLDTNTAPQLEAEIKNNLEGVTDLTIDMKQLEYISSAGLRVLLSAQKLMNKQGEMKIAHVSDMVMEIFDVTGFADILCIVKDDTEEKTEE